MQLLAALLLLASPKVDVHGGNAFQRSSVREAIARVPACLRDASGDSIRAEIVDSDESNAYFDFDSDAIQVNVAAIPGTVGFEKAIKADAAYACTSVRRMRRFGSLDATLMHELTHRWNFDGVHEIRTSLGPGEESNSVLVNRFLALRFTRARAIARRDPRLRSLYRQLNALDAIDSWTDEQQDRFCRVQSELDRRIGHYGFPVRYPGDGPYSLDDRTGGEYFAEALETWAFYPDVFCNAYSAAEREWLDAHLGKCLATSARVPSCVSNPGGDAARRAHRGTR